MDKTEILERLQNRYTVDDKTGCWVWDNTTKENQKLYPQLRIDGIRYYVYKLMIYVRSNINDINNLGLIKHICKNKRCINPDHLMIFGGEKTGFEGYKLDPEIDKVVTKYMKDNGIDNKNKAIENLISIGIYCYVKEKN